VLGTGERGRLIGVNTPETVHPKKAVEAFGKEASAFTKHMVEGKLVRLEFYPDASRRSDGTDRYSRNLAYAFLQDGRHLNAEIIRQFLSVYRQSSDSRRAWPHRPMYEARLNVS
jgi:micrococcal nuclease